MSEYEKNAQIIQLGEAMIKRVYDNFFKIGVASMLTDLDLEETDYSTLAASEVIDKIRGCLAQNPKDVNRLIFLQYLAKYPVSMCKHDVSPILKKLIGFHYRFGVPNEQQVENGAEKVSYEDLSEIFVRSKATISECVNQTEIEWREIQEKAANEQKIEQEARKQLIEEKKQELRKIEQNNQTVAQTTERTPVSPERRIYTMTISENCSLCLVQHGLFHCIYII